MNIIYSASGVLTILFAILLLGKKQKNLADYILAGWFLVILLAIITIYVNYNNLPAWQGLFELTDSSVYLHGPILWFYTLALTDEDFHFRRRHAWHLLPFLLATAYLFYPLLHGEMVSEAGRMMVLVTKMAVLLVYGMAVLWRLNRHEKHIADFFSYTEKIQLNWLRLLVGSMLVIWVIGVVSQSLNAYGVVDIPQYGGYFTNLAVCLFVLVIGYFGIRQATIFVPAHVIELTIQGPVADAGKTTASDEQGAGGGEKKDGPAGKRYQQLCRFMETEQPYLDGDLTLFSLATRLQLPPHQLSKLINQQGGVNFFDFVNRYRVEEVKRRLAQDAQARHTLLAIALDCGFNSKASFNRVFKKMTGHTPRDYSSLM